MQITCEFQAVARFPKTKISVVEVDFNNLFGNKGVSAISSKLSLCLFCSILSANFSIATLPSNLSDGAGLFNLGRLQRTAEPL
jgi:hypothetical protein